MMPRHFIPGFNEEQSVPIFRFLSFSLILLILLSCASSRNQMPTSEPRSLEAQLTNLTDQIIVSLSQKQKSKIAVVEFSDINGEISRFGRYIAEELITRLYRTGKFDVIERQLLNKVMAEHRLNLSGVVDPESAREIGNILGADAIATGSVTDLGTTVKINARLISTETGQLISVAAVKITKNMTIQNLLGDPLSENEPKFSKQNTTDPSQQNRVVMHDDFKFKVIACERVHQDVICSLLVTNTAEKDREFVIQYGYDHTRLYDQDGNKYIVTAAEIANNKRNFSPSGSGYQSVKSKLITGVPVQVKLHFGDVRTSATRITLLDMNCGRKIGRVELRNLEITHGE